MRTDINRIKMSQAVGSFCNINQRADSSNYTEGAAVFLDLRENERERECAGTPAGGDAVIGTRGRGRKIMMFARSRLVFSSIIFRLNNIFILEYIKLMHDMNMYVQFYITISCYSVCMPQLITLFNCSR